VHRPIRDAIGLDVLCCDFFLYGLFKSFLRLHSSEFLLEFFCTKCTETGFWCQIVHSARHLFWINNVLARGSLSDMECKGIGEVSALCDLVIPLHSGQILLITLGNKLCGLC